MLRTTAILAAVLAFGHHEVVPAQAQPAAKIGCVSANKLECGCHVRVKNLTCGSAGSARGVHFFTGLEPKDPLHLVLENEPIELSHATHRGKSVKGDSDGRWVDEYSNESLRIRISYAPGRSTCPEGKGEPCEYSDYNAEVTIKRIGSTPRTLRATATCGC